MLDQPAERPPKQTGIPLPASASHRSRRHLRKALDPGSPDAYRRASVIAPKLPSSNPAHDSRASERMTCATALAAATLSPSARSPPRANGSHPAYGGLPFRNRVSTERVASRKRGRQLDPHRGLAHAPNRRAVPRPRRRLLRPPTPRPHHQTPRESMQRGRSRAIAAGQFSVGPQLRYSRSLLALRAPWGATTITRYLLAVSACATKASVL